jgi:hypothetical protein
MKMFWKYVKAAWRAKFGMPVPLNWFILAFTALAAYYDPAFLLIGAGVEAGYILFLASSQGFQKFVNQSDVRSHQEEQKQKIAKQVARLTKEYEAKYEELVERCKTIIDQQAEETPSDTLEQQAAGLSRLANFYLQLLLSKQAIENRPLDEDDASLAKQLRALDRKLAVDDLSEDVDRSLRQQREILQQRQRARIEAQHRLQYIDAELERIEQQIELLREQTVTDTAPSLVSERIDTVTATLTSTNDWMKQFNKDMGGSGLEDLLSSPPPIVVANEQ